MIKIILGCLLAATIVSCEHSGYEIEKYTGDYRHHNGISEFFDCARGKKYYLSDAGAVKELEQLYAELNLAQNDDVYIEVEGYYKEEPQMEGLDPATVFVVVDILKYDASRGCKLGAREGL